MFVFLSFLSLTFHQGAVTDFGMKVATTGELGSEGCAFKARAHEKLQSLMSNPILASHDMSQ